MFWYRSEGKTALGEVHNGVTHTAHLPVDQCLDFELKQRKEREAISRKLYCSCIQQVYYTKFITADIVHVCMHMYVCMVCMCIYMQVSDLLIDWATCSDRVRCAGCWQVSLVVWTLQLTGSGHQQTYSHPVKQKVVQVHVVVDNTWKKKMQRTSTTLEWQVVYNMYIRTLYACTASCSCSSGWWLQPTYLKAEREGRKAEQLWLQSYVHAFLETPRLKTNSSALTKSWPNIWERGWRYSLCVWQVITIKSCTHIHFLLPCGGGRFFILLKSSSTS